MSSNISKSHNSVTVKSSYLAYLFPSTNKNNATPRSSELALKVLNISGISSIILSYVVSSTKEFSITARVCTNWSNLIHSNSVNNIWERLSRKKWPYILINKKSQNNIKSWQMFYRRRLDKLNGSKSYITKMITNSDIPIENCAHSYKLGDKPTSNDNNTNNELYLSTDVKMDFICPVSLNRLQRTSSPDIDYCTVCKENIYICETESSVKNHTMLGHCISYKPGNWNSRVSYKGKPAYFPQPELKPPKSINVLLTMQSNFCADNLNEAYEKYGFIPVMKPHQCIPVKENQVVFFQRVAERSDVVDQNNSISELDLCHWWLIKNHNDQLGFIPKQCVKR